MYPANYIEEGLSSYLFISDDQGKVIASTSLQNGQHIELRNPLFTGTQFSLTEVDIDQYSASKEVYMRTYTAVDPGTWHLPFLSEEDEDAAAVGEANVIFKDIPVGYHFSLISNGGSDGIPYFDGDNSKVFTLKDQVNFLFLNELGRHCAS